MHHKVIKILLTLFLYSIICQRIYELTLPLKQKKTEKKETYIVEMKETKEKKIGTITIPKINIQNNLYKVGSKENTIEKNITILEESTEPPKTNSIFILAAHSGIGPIAYFKNLDQLTIGDEVILTYKNENYYYLVQTMRETNQDGYISYKPKEEKQLILTTCSPTKNKIQLTIYCLEKRV